MPVEIIQLTMFGDPSSGTVSSKMSSESSLPTEGRTSEPCWRKWQGSETQPLLYLDMRGGDGQLPELLSDLAIRSVGGPTTHSSGAYRRDAEGYAFLRTSTDTPPRRLCSIIYGEKPIIPVKTRLSDILERNPDPKYNLSAKACLGMLRRAERRGKELPEILRKTLEAQCGASRSDSDLRT